MAHVEPLRGIRFDPGVVDLGTVLAPPYDVISDAEQQRLYGRDLRNIVRIDDGEVFAGDVPGVDDRYTRARGHLDSWLRLGVLLHDERPAFYVTEHDFTLPNGGGATRRGLLARVLARPWSESDLRPHEHTLRGPKEDRLALMRATGAQTSPVFAVWQDAPAMAGLLEEITAAAPAAAGTAEGELAAERHRLWVVDEPSLVAQLREAMAPARLYIADGHHRYETAAAYAAERRAGDPDAPASADFEHSLVYLCDAADQGTALLPTHRLLLPRSGAAFSIDDLWMRLDDAWNVSAAPGLDQAMASAAAVRDERHAFAVVAREGAALLSRPRHGVASPRAALDVVVLQEEVLAPAGVDAEAVSAGALRYTRDPEELTLAVARGEALLGFALNGATSAQMIAVADAGEVMPQKSTYFYPKVPTGLVLSPL